MQIEITAKKENKLLGREEVNFKTLHEKESTPKRDMIREKLAGMFSVKKENVVVDFLEPEFGKNATIGYAKIYKSTEDAKKLEREHILVRNKLAEKKTKEKKEEKKAEAKPSAKEEPKKEEAKKEEKPKTEEKKSEKKEEQKVEEKKSEKKAEPKSEAKKEEKSADKKEEKKTEKK